MDCQIDKSYPKVEVEMPNIEYAKILLEDYAGIVSEETAINQYIYQHFDKFDTNQLFSETLSKIAMVEMHHLELLGETIKLLGLNPIFKVVESNNYLTYWSSSYVYYNTNIIEMLKNDIKIEEEAIRNYRYHISIIDDKFIKKLLYRIIEDEEQHIKCFNMLLNECMKF